MARIVTLEPLTINRDGQRGPSRSPARALLPGDDAVLARDDLDVGDERPSLRRAARLVAAAQLPATGGQRRGAVHSVGPRFEAVDESRPRLRAGPHERVAAARIVFGWR